MGSHTDVNGQFPSAQLKATMIQIRGSHSNGNQIHGMRFYDKQEKTVRTVFLNSKGDYWENKGSLFKDKTITEPRA